MANKANARHAIITGGSKGLGLQVAERLLDLGYTVTVNYRSDKQAILQLTERWSAHMERVQFVKGDVANKQEIVNLIQQAYTRFERIDVLIHNAGPYIFQRKKLADYDDDEWTQMIDGNLSSFYYLFKQVVPIMRNQQFGRIIAYGFQGAGTAPGWLHRSAYAAAKVGVVSLMKTISIEEAEFGITANMVCPGNILGDMKESRIEESRKHKDPNTPIGRSGTGEDIARAISFLCEDDSDMITGAVLEVTGGLDVIHRFR